MYAIRVFYRMNRMLKGWTTIGKWTLSVKFDYMFQAVNYAKMMKKADKQLKTEGFETHYVPVKLVSKEEYISSLWDEFNYNYNKFEHNENANPINDFCKWMKCRYGIESANEEYNGAKWDEFSYNYNKFEHNENANPINDFCEWMKYHYGNEFVNEYEERLNEDN